jgi:hypothetical protein
MDIVCRVADSCRGAGLVERAGQAPTQHRVVQQRSRAGQMVAYATTAQYTCSALRSVAQNTWSMRWASAARGGAIGGRRSSERRAQPNRRDAIDPATRHRGENRTGRPGKGTNHGRRPPRGRHLHANVDPSPTGEQASAWRAWQRRSGPRSGTGTVDAVTSIDCATAIPSDPRKFNRCDVSSWRVPESTGIQSGNWPVPPLRGD